MNRIIVITSQFLNNSSQIITTVLLHKLLYKKLVMLFMVPRHVSKIGTLMLVNPQSVMLRAVPVTLEYGLKSLVRRSV